MRGWLDDGVLVRDPAPSLYLYRMAFVDDHGRRRHTTGVLGAVGLEPPGEGDVLPHERTTTKDRSDRLELLRATEANLSPIWFLSMARGLTKLLDPPGQPLAGMDRRRRRRPRPLAARRPARASTPSAPRWRRPRSSSPTATTATRPRWPTGTSVGPWPARRHRATT